MRVRYNRALKHTQSQKLVNQVARAETSGFWKFLAAESKRCFQTDGCDDRGLHTTNTLALCNWQPWVITARTTGETAQTGENRAHYCEKHNTLSWGLLSE